MKGENHTRVRWLHIGLWGLLTALCLPQVIRAQDKSVDSVWYFNPHAQEPMHLLFDYYHHGLPNTKVGKYITTGSWVNTDGRYGWDDFVHTNTFDHAYTILEKDFSIGMARQPFTSRLLQQTDGVVIIAADNPASISNAKVISDEEITALRKFVNEGGSLMVMVNGGGDSRFSESFESQQLRKLVNGFGLQWNNDDTHYSDNIIPADHPYFYDIPVFHYGAGCTLNILPEATRPEVLLDVYSDAGYTDRSVKGHGVVMVRPGKGKFILVGDAGSWTGNLSRPWADNERVLKQLFRYMKPDRQVHTKIWKPGDQLRYAVTVAGLQAVPYANALSTIPKPLYHTFSPREITKMPFIEGQGELTLRFNKQNERQAYELCASINRFGWFDSSEAVADTQRIDFVLSKQGKVTDVKPKGLLAQWLSPEISLLAALLPVDGLHPGDQWESTEYIRIPALRGTDIPAVKPLEMHTEYVDDVSLTNRKCRYLRADGEIWLKDLDVQVADLLPEEYMRKVGGSDFSYFNKRGGKLLFKREQWVDQYSGVVRKARLQVRIITWIADKRKSPGANNAERDNNMIVSVAHITNFMLQTNEEN